MVFAALLAPAAPLALKVAVARVVLPPLSPETGIVVLDRNANFKLVRQMQIWNPDYAFAYPALTSNGTGEVGMSLEYGGGTRYENHVVGFWGDFVLCATTATNAGVSRFRDYVTIRPDPTGQGPVRRVRLRRREERTGHRIDQRHAVRRLPSPLR